MFSQIPGRVLAVGHSYGGAIITNAATDAGNVVGLVYVAAFAPDEGEALQDIEAGSTDSVLNAAIRPSNYPTGSSAETAVEFSIDPASFHDAFAGDLSEKDAAVVAAAQRPVAAAAFGEKNGSPAWKNLPAWAVVATGDKAAGADVVRSMAKRAKAEIAEVEGSHVIMISQPQAVPGRARQGPAWLPRRPAADRRQPTGRHHDPAGPRKAELHHEGRPLPQGARRPGRPAAQPGRADHQQHRGRRRTAALIRPRPAPGTLTPGGARTSDSRHRP